MHPALKVVALTAFDDAPYVRDLLKAGAAGYVLKRAVLQELVRAIHVVHGGGVFLDPELASRTTVGTQTAPSTLQADLSAREIEVASLAARGFSNCEIAGELRIAVKTVEAHKTRLMGKLGIATRAQLVRYAVYRGWLSA